MLSKGMMGWGAIVVAVLMALTQLMSWPGYLHYIWAILVLVWGFLAMAK